MFQFWQFFFSYLEGIFPSLPQPNANPKHTTHFRRPHTSRELGKH